MIKMMLSKTNKAPMVWSLVASLIALQAAVLGWMVWDNESLLSDGHEIRLDVEPVDPRSLFRGDYVILSYKGLSELSAQLFIRKNDRYVEYKTGLKIGRPLGVVLAKNGSNESWEPIRIADDCHKHQPETEVCLAGTIARVHGRQGEHGVRVTYGLENYFVAEGEGRKLEKAIQIKSMQVLLAVNAKGRAIIKGLFVDGQQISQEGLF